QQVWLGEAGVAASAGSFTFTTLIGSILNRGITLGSLAATKLTTPSSQYGVFDNGNGQYTTTNSPPDSPYSASGVQVNGTVSANTNGGGLTFGSSALHSGNYDNLLVIGNQQLPSLLSNSGSHGETEYLFLSGFPVYNQQTNPKIQTFSVINAGGAYEALFNSPIHEPYYIAGNSINNADFSLLGKNWTIVSYTAPNTLTPGSSSVAVTGTSKIGLAQSLVPLSTVYVGKNLTSGPFTVQLADLGTATSSGVSPAAINVYYNGVLSNSTSIFPGNTVKYNVSGSRLWVKVNQTFAGLYAYQKWAKIQMYSGLYNLTSGSAYNNTINKGWSVTLLWTNTSSATGKAVDLAGIILYNTTPTLLTPGQSFTFMQNPATYKVTFAGDTLGSNFDGITIASGYASSIDYANGGTQ
ncbi:MAG: hypothetical protein KGI04_05045, partial [Candidatus Micrarchaeota archaeon]|nr:hypothetical protein [Candidatus Micrarchaeota archaeon]